MQTNKGPRSDRVSLDLGADFFVAYLQLLQKQQQALKRITYNTRIDIQLFPVVASTSGSNGKHLNFCHRITDAGDQVLPTVVRFSQWPLAHWISALALYIPHAACLMGCYKAQSIGDNKVYDFGQLMLVNVFRQPIGHHPRQQGHYVPIDLCCILGEVLPNRSRPEKDRCYIPIDERSVPLYGGLPVLGPAFSADVTIIFSLRHCDSLGGVCYSALSMVESRAMSKIENEMSNEVTLRNS